MEVCDSHAVCVCVIGMLGILGIDMNNVNVVEMKSKSHVNEKQGTTQKVENHSFGGTENVMGQTLQTSQSQGTGTHMSHEHNHDHHNDHEHHDVHDDHGEHKHHESHSHF